LLLPRTTPTIHSGKILVLLGSFFEAKAATVPFEEEISSEDEAGVEDAQEAPHPPNIDINLT
jgi:hypothetical protein